MAKVLVIRKTDKTIHKAPLATKATLIAYNNRAKLGWKFEEMDEEEANKLPFIDANYVTAAESVQKAESLQKENEAKDAEIERLKKLLEEKNGKAEPTAAQKIEQIGSAETIEAVNALLEGESRSTVISAGEKRKKELESK